jgi:hypothetical protein
VRGARRGRPERSSIESAATRRRCRPSGSRAGAAAVISVLREQARARAIWEELQSLPLAQYPNAISALARILLELSVDGYLQNRGLEGGNNLPHKVGAAAADLLARDVLDQQYYDELDRLRLHDELISIRSMQRYVHSPTFAPLPRELITYWTRLGRLIAACLSH